MNRGDRQEAIFDDDSDLERFLETLGEVCLKTGWQVHAYCLMGNHFHLVLETPQAPSQSCGRNAMVPESKSWRSWAGRRRTSVGCAKAIRGK